MEMATIEMPRAEARQAFLEYRRAVRKRHSTEDEMIMRGYRALSQGHQVINLMDVMKAAGVDEHGRPKLAIARADELHVWMNRSSRGFRFCGKQWCRARCDASRHKFIPYEESGAWSMRSYKGIVPSIPPGMRPAASLTNYQILWEADWQAVPRDPALLKHCGGWLYVVLAMWDLTPLEQAVLGLTRN